MASKFIYTVATGVTNQVGVAGTILGVGESSKTVTAADFDNSSLTSAGIALAQVPTDVVANVGAILGTPLAAGTGNTPFADQAALDAGITQPPIYDHNLFYNGTVWTLGGNRSGGQVATFTITAGGSDYAVATGLAATTGNERFSAGLTVDVTSVDGSGPITGVSVNTGGHLWKVGDTVNVVGGSGSAVLTVATISFPTIGQMSIGRTGNVMNNSNFSTTPYGVSPQLVYLKQPTTGVIMRYDSSLGGSTTYGANGDTFNGSDFSLEIRGVRTDELLGTLTVPSGTNTNVNITAGS